MQVFYKDKSSLFEAKITIEGASLANTSARLILKLSENKNLLFYGSLNEDICTFDIPALKEIKEDKGSLVLEIIADNTIFEGFTDDIQFKQSKSVRVEVVNKSKDSDNKPRIIVETSKKNITTEKKTPIIEKKSEKVKPEVLKTRLVKLFKESINKKMISENDLKSYLPSKSAMKLVESFPGVKDPKTKQHFQFFIDKFPSEKITEFKNILEIKQIF